MKKKFDPFRVILNSTKAAASNAWIAGVAAFGEFSQTLAKSEFVSKLNTFSNEVSKAMDGSFKMGAVDLETGLKMSPNTHRILDGGHGFFESITKAQEVGLKEGWSNAQTFEEWAKAYFTDLSSPAGMPAFAKLSDDIYHFLRKTLKLDEALARDLVTVNGQEAIESLIGGTLAAVSLLYSWTAKDKEAFSRAIGSLLLCGTISMNPAVLVVVIASAAVGYNTLVCRKAVEKGMLASGIVMLTSVLIPGPLIIGLVAGIVLAVFANKKLKSDLDISALIFAWLKSMSTSEGRNRALDSMRAIVDDLDALLRANLKKVA